MNRIIPHRIFFLLIFLFLGATVTQAGVIGKGQAEIFGGNEGSAKNQAKRNAIRDAVEKGAGTYLDAKTKVKNWEVIRDEVITSAVGSVKTYEVLRDEKVGNTWYYEIDAEVSASTETVKNKLEELRILHQKMGNKRFMVIYNPEHPDALKEDHGAVLSAETAINQELADQGFRIFEQKSVTHLFNRFNSNNVASKNLEAWMKIANEQQVDILAEMEVTGSHRRKAGFEISAAKALLRMKIYDVSTGRLISSTQAEQKQMTNARPGSFDWDNAIAKASAKAGTEVAAQSVDNIVNFYKTVGDIGNAFFIVFKDFTEDEVDQLLTILENMDGYQSLSELKNSPNLVEIEYFSNMNKGRLRRKIRLNAKKKGIRLLTEEVSGNRFVFTKSLH